MENKTMDVFEFIKLNRDKPKHGLQIVNIRGCNGAGKSSVPMQMMANDPDCFTITFWDGKKNKEFATVFPKFKTLALGLYRNKTGGLDGYPSNEYTEEAMKKLWNVGGYNIICEGIMASTIRSTWINLFERFITDPLFIARKITILSILPPFETCIDRVIARSGNPDIKKDQILSKWRTVERNHNIFSELDWSNAIRFDNSSYTLEETLSWFNELVRFW